MLRSNSRTTSDARRNAALALWFTSGVLGGLAFGQSPARRFPVTSEMIASAMQHRQLPVEGVQIRLAAPITSSVNNPMLDIESMQRSNSHNAQLRIACRNHTECLSFYVSVTWPESASPGALVAGTDSMLRSSVSAVTDGKPAGGEQATLRVGAPATLLIEEGRVHITLRVVSLGSGATGDKVRVVTPDHKITYQAEVVSPTLLKGPFLK